ncbi:hypothetical protein RRG08_063994 [Elysia crispata]|uniref:Uncharacterized protein n=1 Tax=Elysia crispata TaxID=231223 RepID=A0AAE0YFR5_9GAST|nr:hypothetical protein RRG08_063994 [Elysia crispata]
MSRENSTRQFPLNSRMHALCLPVFAHFGCLASLTLQSLHVPRSLQQPHLRSTSVPSELVSFISSQSQLNHFTPNV